MDARKNILGALILVFGTILILSASPIASRRPVLGTPMPSATASPSATPTRTPTATPRPSLTPTATATATRATAPPTPTATPAGVHLWLASPLLFDSEAEPYQSDYFPYGADRKPFRLHHGADFPKAGGTPVTAPADSIVVVAGTDKELQFGARLDFYGNLVILELDASYQGQAVYVLFGHLSEIAVQSGQRVKRGEIVGLVGGTGAAFGATHLHVEVRLGENSYDATRNPMLWLEPGPGLGVIAGLLLDARGKPVPTLAITVFRADRPARWWRETLTYAASEVNPDEFFGENFALGYVPAGDYLVKAKLGDRTIVRPVTVRPGEIAFVVIRPD